MSERTDKVCLVTKSRIYGHRNFRIYNIMQDIFYPFIILAVNINYPFYVIDDIDVNTMKMGNIFYSVLSTDGKEIVCSSEGNPT